MNFKSLSLLVTFGLALGVTAPAFAKKGKVAQIASHTHKNIVQKSAESLGSLVTNQAEADIGHINFDFYDFASTEIMKNPELEVPVTMPVATDLLEKADKAIYASFDALKNGLKIIKEETERHPVVTAVIVLPILAAGIVGTYQYLKNSENK